MQQCQTFHKSHIVNSYPIVRGPEEDVSFLGHKGPLIRIELAVKQTIELSVIWDSMNPMWHHCNRQEDFLQYADPT